VIQDLIDFAEETRRRSIELLSKALAEQTPPHDPFDVDATLVTARVEPGSPAALAARLCDVAGDTVRQAQMLVERSEGYELRGLVAATPLD
jgi:hypothetical protein